MRKQVKNIILCFTIVMVLLTSIAYANTTIYDKKGHEVQQTIAPTAESTIDPDTNSNASSNKFGSNTNNVISKATIDIVETIATASNAYTMIRHTPSISNVDSKDIELITDTKTGRLRMLIKISGVGVQTAKNGFYKVDGKTFYFDEDGVMVLGNAKDPTGNEYFFSYETGELLKEIQK